MPSHIWAIMLRCGLLLPLLFSFQLNPAAAAEAPPDLAALVIRPSDLESMGLTNMGIGRSILADRARQAAEFTDAYFGSWHESGAPTGTAIRRANPDLTYIQFLGNDTDHVIVTLMAFPGARDAERGMEAYADTIEDWFQDDVSDLEMDGIDAAISFTIVPEHPNARPVDTIVFLQKATMVVVQSWSAPRSDGVSLEDIAALQRDRLNEGGPTDMSDLVSRMMRLRVRGWNTDESSYTVIDGEAIRILYETRFPEIFEHRQDEVYSSGIVDWYKSTQVVYGDWTPWWFGGSSEPVASLLIQIITFDPEIGTRSPEDARKAYADYSEVSVPIDGYESFGVFASLEETGLNEWYVVWVWLDEQTLMTFQHLVESGGGKDIPEAFELDIATTNEIIQRQIACFEGARFCDTPVRSPYTYGES